MRNEEEEWLNKNKDPNLSSEDTTILDVWIIRN